ncbi:MAG: undecaprenyl-diphosphate phosphatase [Streptosporangiales bacterium]|nr:undecaprenyl-diphosphate phosphatase [Streptosporangiales bacterium]
MNTFQAAVLGIVQGLTEFLPISSTAHLRVVPAFAGWRDPGAAFTAVTQLGTMTAVLAYFWRDIVRIAWTWLRSLWTPGLRRDLDARMGWYIGLGTIPIGICGVTFKDQIETGARNLWLISGALIGLGLLLLAADRMGRQKRDLNHINLRDGLIIGAFQALALIPGVSRSGATITGGLFLGYTRESAARYSFLLSVPAVVLSGLFELPEIGGANVPGILPTAVATVLAFVVGYASIAWLLRFLARHSTMVFVVYRVALGGLIIGLLSTGVIAATG